MNDSRDVSIDLLRFIALSGIILVHIGPSPFFSQLRSFDVPLMVFLSGISYCLSSRKGSSMLYMSYCVKRFKRLILPVWFFLPVYFLIYTITSNELPSLYQVATYFTFATNWYVWIIRVFFIIALLAPLVAAALLKINSKQFYAIIIGAFVLFECLVDYGNFTSFRSILVLTNIPYILVFALGYKALSFSKKQSVCIGGGTLMVYVVFALHYYSLLGEYVPTQKFKYPPQLYYSSYALGVCYILWGIRDKIDDFFNRLSSQFAKLCCFIGSHTMWIYLWHIPVVDAVEQQYNAPVRFFLVYAVALATTYVQCKLVDALAKRLSNEQIKKNLRTIFIG